MAPPAILLVTTTYLNFHWITDGLAGLLHRAPWDHVPLPGALRRWDRPSISTP